MRTRLGLRLVLAIVVALAATAGPTLASPTVTSHAGTVVAVDPSARALVVKELAENGRETKLSIHVLPQARIALSERLPESDIKDFSQLFRETPLDLADLRPGDFVVVRSTTDQGRKVADEVTVTLRGT